LHELNCEFLVRVERLNKFQHEFIVLRHGFDVTRAKDLFELVFGCVFFVHEAMLLSYIRNVQFLPPPLEVVLISTKVSLQTPDFANNCLAIDSSLHPRVPCVDGVGHVLDLARVGARCEVASRCPWDSESLHAQRFHG
jgi:hypothetical protein